jgi:hypothetical protein
MKRRRRKEKWGVVKRNEEVRRGIVGKKKGRQHKNWGCGRGDAMEIREES